MGGSALILLGHLSRATHDIDAISVPAELYSLLAKYDINTNSEAYINNFPYNFEDRLVPLPLQGQCIDFYTPCLEDLVIAKLCSARDTDLQLNPGNINAWLKHGDGNKVSLTHARQMLQYLRQV